ncbi:MAG: OmpP1/FadL family transporter [Polyangiales bacterium]
MRRGHAQLVGASICVASLLGTRIAAASPQDLFGFGAHVSAMGGAGPASAEGYEAVFGGPALLAEAREQTLTLGVGIAAMSLHADTPTRATTVDVDPMQNVTIGAALPIPFGGVLADRVTFGVGFLDPTQFLIRAQILYPERLQYPIVAPRVQSLGVLLGGGIRIGDNLFVGGGFEALAALIGQISLQLDSTGHVNSSSDDQVVAAYAPVLSVAYDFIENLRLGVTYRGELAARFSVTVHSQDLGIPVPDFNVAGLAQYDPEQVAAEVRWSSIGRAPLQARSRAWRLVAGVIYRRWSRYPGPLEPTVTANTDYGPPPIAAHDTLSPRVGIERAEPLSSSVGVRLRAGYAFEPSPLPAQTTSFAMPADGVSSSANELDSDRHVFTAGLGVVFGPKSTLQIDLVAQLHVLTSRDHVKDSTVPSDAPGWPSVRSYGTILVAGATAGVRF